MNKENSNIEPTKRGVVVVTETFGSTLDELKALLIIQSALNSTAGCVPKVVLDDLKREVSEEVLDCYIKHVSDKGTDSGDAGIDIALHSVEIVLVVQGSGELEDYMDEFEKAELELRAVSFVRPGHVFDKLLTEQTSPRLYNPTAHATLTAMFRTTPGFTSVAPADQYAFAVECNQAFVEMPHTAEDGMVIQKWQKHVIEEKNALDEKIKYMNTFIETDIFMTFTNDEVNMFRAQLNSMETYRTILEYRIAHF